MNNKCTYCHAYLYGSEEEKVKTCDRCVEQVKKFDEKTIDWLMMVIDGRVEAALDEHTERYSHESSSYGYY